MHCPAHLARHVGRSQERCDLAVSKDFATWDRPDYGIDSLEELTILNCRLVIVGTA